ncbi:DnaK suppressor protein [Candidatus Kinetoplastibacterium desouzaii TCC079E]|uniref:RNA polymerase-binding transcription factor DksA n=1 Tax=Candidatus Kinetoplastidibacterium desouzai TCC079E TaxID=1208919 RepID=M1L3C4_9PROT|nr:DnaK suppressor protein [Candidatus Kinetoplastibacterium desouzaii TCC079E]
MTANKVTSIEDKCSVPMHNFNEQDILAMSEEDYMNDIQLAFFKKKLQQLEQEILLKAEATTEYLKETQFVPDPADRATIEEEHALELKSRDRERKLLKKIQKSIARIESKDYGWCEETGEPIGIPRLLARPTATLSLEAQERREMRQKLYGKQ